MRLSQNKPQFPEKFEVPSLYNGTGNTLLLDNLLGWGINLYFLTNGGGAVHLNEYIRLSRSLYDLTTDVPRGFVIHETLAAYAAAIRYLGERRIGACSLTTGGVPDIANPAIIEAMMHSSPAIYLAALSASNAGKKAPLQDTTEIGFRTATTMKERHGNGCQVIDRIDSLEKVLYNVRDRLLDLKPVLILYHPDVIKERIPWFEVPWVEKPRQFDQRTLDEFLASFPQETNGKKVVLFVGEEAARYERMTQLTTALARLLKAPT